MHKIANVVSCVSDRSQSTLKDLSTEEQLAAKAGFAKSLLHIGIFINASALYSDRIAVDAVARVIFFLFSFLASSNLGKAK